MPLQAIVFDFDGVIADTEPLHLLAFQEELKAIGLSLSRAEYLDRYLGYTDREGFAAVGIDRGRPFTPGQIEDLIARKTVRMQALLAATPGVFPGVPERIREWSRHVPIAIASGALRAEIEAVVRAAGIAGCFRTIVSADDPVSSKPSPEPYRLALGRLAAAGAAAGDGRLDPASCVAIEDSRWGIAAAKAAGMRVVGVTSSYGEADLKEADRIVASVADLSLGDLAG